MRLSVVIPHFYRQREANLTEIVRSLCLGSAWPNEVIVWNNESAPVHVTRPMGLPVLVVDSPRNVGAQARLIAATMARGEWVLFLDNDVAVNRFTVENLMRWKSSLESNAVVTLEGRERTDRSYAQWPKIYGHGIATPRQLFLSLGRGELVSRKTLLSVLKDFPFEESTVMDDLHLSAAYAANGVPVFVVPCQRGESDLAELSMGGVGLCKEPDFYARRDVAARAIVIPCDEETLRAQAESA